MIVVYALRVYTDQRRLWRQAVDLEKNRGSTYASLSPSLLVSDLSLPRRASLNAILASAVQHYPQPEVLWLIAAKEKWNQGQC